VQVRHIRIVVACVAALLSPIAQASAQVQFGPQVSVGTDSGLGLGARLIFPLRTDALGVDGAIDANYFFGGGRAVDSWIDTNVNLRLPIPLAQDFVTRIGAGVNFTFISRDAPGQTTDTDTDAGLNLLIAFQVPRDRVSPYFDLRAVLGGAEQAVLTAGFTFGPPR
jgi:hypothetical protein